VARREAHPKLQVLAPKLITFRLGNGLAGAENCGHQPANAGNSQNRIVCVFLKAVVSRSIHMGHRLDILLGLQSPAW
jgi:hypothetical protein